MSSIYLVPFAIAINLFIIYYIYILDKNTCDCSESNKFKKKYIKWYAVCSLVILVLFYVLPTIVKYISIHQFKTLSGILLSPILYNILEIYLIFGILNLYIINRLTNDLYKSKCKCNIDIFNRFLYYYSIGIIIIYICVFIISIDLSLTI